MLKFWQKLRQKLINEGNLRKYLIYAIGEILLVVIGILIALQINNWNELRKERSLEMETLREIKDALKEDLLSVEFVLNSHNQILKSQSIVIQWIESRGSYYDSLDFHFANSVRATHALLRQGPYETLKDVGIRLIKNDSVRSQIQNLYDFTYEWYEKNSEKYKIDANDMVKNVNVRFFENPVIEGSTLIDDNIQMKPIDTEKIQNDNEFLYTLKVNADFNRFLININMEPTAFEIKQLIQSIESELQN